MSWTELPKARLSDGARFATAGKKETELMTAQVAECGSGICHQ